jgi:hypothetical protein
LSLLKHEGKNMERYFKLKFNSLVIATVILNAGYCSSIFAQSQVVEVGVIGGKLKAEVSDYKDYFEVVNPRFVIEKIEFLIAGSLAQERVSDNRRISSDAICGSLFGFNKSRPVRQNAEEEMSPSDRLLVATLKVTDSQPWNYYELAAITLTSKYGRPVIKRLYCAKPTDI